MKYAKNKAPEKCKVVYCRNDHAKGRTICNTCKSREYIKNNRPLMVWHWLKKSAKRRDINFDLPKEYFFNFLFMNKYIQNSGRLSEQFSIDRIKPELGYIQGNLQILTKSENTKKYHEQEKNYQHPF